MQIFFWVYIILMDCLKYSVSFEYLPPTKEMEIYKGEKYTFGILRTPNDDVIKYCYYETDTGINEYFEIYEKPKPSTNYSVGGFALPQSYYTQILQRIEMNVITDHGSKGECKITVDRADETGPKVWTLTPVTCEEDTYPKCNKLEAVEFNVHLYIGVSLAAYEIHVLEGNSFFNHLKMPSGVTLTSCYLKFRDTRVDLDLHSSSPAQVWNLYKNYFKRHIVEHAPYGLGIILTGGGRDTVKKIRSLGYGLCGFHLVNIILNEEGNMYWSLYAGDNEGKMYKQEFYGRVALKIDESFLHSRVFAEIGSEYTLTCGQQHAQAFCTLFNPDGKVVEANDNCVLNINTVSMNDIGMWKCYSGIKTSFESIEHTVELNIEGIQKVESWLKNEENYIELGCKVLNHRGGDVNLCKFIAPNKRTYNVGLGSATERYLSVGTDFRAAQCMIQIKKPLQEFEKGIWLCELVGPYKLDYGGSFINVGEVELPDYSKHFVITTELHKSLSIFCEVPFSSEHCFIKSPNGTIYSSEKPMQTYLGRCSLTVKNVTPTDNGTWACLFARETGIPDEEIKVEVTIAEVLSYFKKIEVDVGSNAQLKCNTGNLALSYCRFVSPSGVSYHLRKRQPSASINYFGKGLEYGDCGIEISNVQTSDIGLWTCVVQLVRDQTKPELLAQIELNVAEGVNIAAIGIGVAVVAVTIAAILGVVFSIKYKRRRHAERVELARRQRTVDDDNLSNESEINIFQMEVIQPVPS